MNSDDVQTNLILQREIFNALSIQLQQTDPVAFQKFQQQQQQMKQLEQQMQQQQLQKQREEEQQRRNVFQQQIQHLQNHEQPHCSRNNPARKFEYDEPPKKRGRPPGRKSAKEPKNLRFPKAPVPPPPPVPSMLHQPHFVIPQMPQNQTMPLQILNMNHQLMNVPGTSSSSSIIPDAPCTSSSSSYHSSLPKQFRFPPINKHPQQPIPLFDMNPQNMVPLPHLSTRPLPTVPSIDPPLPGTWPTVRSEYWNSFFGNSAQTHVPVASTSYTIDGTTPPQVSSTTENDLIDVVNVTTSDEQVTVVQPSQPTVENSALAANSSPALQSMQQQFQIIISPQVVPNTSNNNVANDSDSMRQFAQTMDHANLIGVSTAHSVASQWREEKIRITLVSNTDVPNESPYQIDPSLTPIQPEQHEIRNEDMPALEASSDETAKLPEQNGENAGEPSPTESAPPVLEQEQNPTKMKESSANSATDTSPSPTSSSSSTPAAVLADAKKTFADGDNARRTEMTRRKERHEEEARPGSADSQKTLCYDDEFSKGDIAKQVSMNEALKQRLAEIEATNYQAALAAATHKVRRRRTKSLHKVETNESENETLNIRKRKHIIEENADERVLSKYVEELEAKLREEQRARYKFEEIIKKKMLMEQELKSSLECMRHDRRKLVLDNAFLNEVIAPLQKKLKEMEADLVMSKEVRAKDLKSLQENMEEIRKEYKSLEEVLDKKQSALRKANAQNKDLQESLDSLKISKCDLELVLDNEKAVRANAEDELTEERQKREQKEKQLGDEKERLREILAEEKIINEETKVEISKVKTELEAARFESDQERRKYLNLQTIVKQETSYLESQLTDARCELEAADEVKKNHSKTVEDLKAALLESGKKGRSLQALLLIERRRRRNLVVKLSKEKETVRRLEEKLDDEMVEMAMKTAECEGLRVQLEKEQTEKKSMYDEKVKAKIAQDSIQKRLDNANLERFRVQQDLDKESKERENLQELLDENKGRIESMEEDLVVEMNERRILVEKIAIGEETRRALEKTIDEEREVNTNLLEKLEKKLEKEQRSREIEEAAFEASLSLVREEKAKLEEKLREEKEYRAVDLANFEAAKAKKDEEMKQNEEEWSKRYRVFRDKERNRSMHRCQEGFAAFMEKWRDDNSREVNEAECFSLKFNTNIQQPANEIAAPLNGVSGDGPSHAPIKSENTVMEEDDGIDEAAHEHDYAERVDPHPSKIRRKHHQEIKRCTEEDTPMKRRLRVLKTEKDNLNLPQMNTLKLRIGYLPPKRGPKPQKNKDYK